MTLLGSLKGTFGGEEVAGGVVGLVISTADLEGEAALSLSVCLWAPGCVSHSLAGILPQWGGSWWGPGTHTWECCSRPPHTLFPSCSDGSGRRLCQRSAQTEAAFSTNATQTIFSAIYLVQIFPCCSDCFICQILMLTCLYI